MLPPRPRPSTRSLIFFRSTVSLDHPVFLGTCLRLAPFAMAPAVFAAVGRRTVAAVATARQAAATATFIVNAAVRSAAYVREHANLPAEVRASTVRLAANEGCSISGTLWVHRVPGAFHVIAKSDAHTFDAANTNTSHIVRHLSFGAPLSPSVMHRVPRDVAAAIHPLDGRSFVNTAGAQSHEHYIKVVSTHYRTGTLVGTRDVLGYQQSVSSMKFDAAPAVPEAKFSYDLSPTAVVIQQAGRRWYDFLTNLVAILGGAFTVFGLLDGAVYRLRKGNRKGATSPLSAAATVKSPQGRAM